MKRWMRVLVLLAVSAAVAHAAARPKVVDEFWTAPDIAAFRPASIALLPAATYDHSVESQQLVESAIGQAFRGSGHRWLSASFAREQLRAAASGDSLLKALAGALLKKPRLDSLQAPLIGRTVRARALLTVRVDQLEKHLLEVDENGRPSTTVQLTMALVDSTGRLLWTAHGGETMEGPYQDGNAHPIGVSASGLNNLPVTAQGGAPDYREVLAKILARFADALPAAPGAAPSAH